HNRKSQGHEGLNLPHGRGDRCLFVWTGYIGPLHIYCIDRWFAYVLGKIAWMGGATTPSSERTPAS
ncbi:unnamed protein product, partial [Ectocarpus sp. 8 AP-2014]